MINGLKLLFELRQSTFQFYRLSHNHIRSSGFNALAGNHLLKYMNRGHVTNDSFNGQLNLERIYYIDVMFTSGEIINQ